MDYLENKWTENRVIVKKTSEIPNKEIKPKQTRVIYQKYQIQKLKQTRVKFSTTKQRN